MKSKGDFVAYLKTPEKWVKDETYQVAYNPARIWTG